MITCITVAMLNQAVSVTATGSGGVYTITATVTPGTFSIASVDIKVDGTVVSTIAAPGPYTYSYTVPATATAIQSVTATVTEYWTVQRDFGRCHNPSAYMKE